MRLDLDFSGRHVMVFGGTTGINLGIADCFAQRRGRVAVVSRKQENVDAAVAQLSRHGGEVLGLVADVRDPQAVQAAVEAVNGVTVAVVELTYEPRWTPDLIRSGVFPVAARH